VLGRNGSTTSSWYGDCLPSRDFPMLIAQFLTGRLPLAKFVTETTPLDGIEATDLALSPVTSVGGWGARRARATVMTLGSLGLRAGKSPAFLCVVD